MLDKFDIAKLQDLPIEQVAGALAIRVVRHKAVCPFHDDTRPSLTFNIKKNRFRCYVCGARGGVIDLVMNTQGWNFYESCQWLAREFGIILSEEPRNFKAREIKKQEQKVHPSREDSGGSPDIPYLTRLMAQPVLNAEAEHFLFCERRLSREVIRELGISSISYSCPMSSSPRPAYFDGPALLIPYRDIEGNLMSVQSRYLGKGGKPRFRFPKGSACHIFNLPVLKNLPKGSNLYLTEGVSDCLAYLSKGLYAVAIPSSTLLKEEDAKLLNGFTLHICPDSDEPGERLFLQLRAIFPKIIRHQLPAGFKDIGQYWAAIKC